MDNFIPRMPIYMGETPAHDPAQQRKVIVDYLSGQYQGKMIQLNKEGRLVAVDAPKGAKSDAHRESINTIAQFTFAHGLMKMNLFAVHRLSREFINVNSQASRTATLGNRILGRGNVDPHAILQKFGGYMRQIMQENLTPAGIVQLLKHADVDADIILKNPIVESAFIEVLSQCNKEQFVEIVDALSQIRGMTLSENGLRTVASKLNSFGATEPWTFNLSSLRFLHSQYMPEIDHTIFSLRVELPTSDKNALASIAHCLQHDKPLPAIAVIRELLLENCPWDALMHLNAATLKFLAHAMPEAFDNHLMLKLIEKSDDPTLVAELIPLSKHPVSEIFRAMAANKSGDAILLALPESYRDPDFIRNNANPQQALLRASQLSNPAFFAKISELVPEINVSPGFLSKKDLEEALKKPISDELAYQMALSFNLHFRDAKDLSILHRLPQPVNEKFLTAVLTHYYKTLERHLDQIPTFLTHLKPILLKSGFTLITALIENGLPLGEMTRGRGFIFEYLKSNPQPQPDQIAAYLSLNPDLKQTDERGETLFDHLAKADVYYPFITFYENAMDQKAAQIALASGSMRALRSFGKPPIELEELTSAAAKALAQGESPETAIRFIEQFKEKDQPMGPYLHSLMQKMPKNDRAFSQLIQAIKWTLIQEATEEGKFLFEQHWVHYDLTRIRDSKGNFGLLDKLENPELFLNWGLLTPQQLVTEKNLNQALKDNNRPLIELIVAQSRKLQLSVEEQFLFFGRALNSNASDAAKTFLMWNLDDYGLCLGTALSGQTFLKFAEENYPNAVRFIK